MKRFNVLFGLLLALGATVATAIVFTVPAMAGNGAIVQDLTNTPKAAYPLSGTGYDFGFWNGNRVIEAITPTSYHAVTTPSGVHNQVLKGVVANDTGATVTYSANSGDPVPAGQTCWSFATGATSTDWLMTIEADGHFTLSCHFPATS